MKMEGLVMKVDPQLKRAISVGLSYIGVVYMISGVDALLKGFGIGPAGVVAINPLLAVAVGVGLTWAFIEWGIRK